MSSEINRIKDMFPNPETGSTSFSGKSESGGRYCVGGAYIMYSFPSTYWKDRDLCFPNVKRLAKAFVDKTSMEQTQAEELARLVIEANDVEEFEEAWELLSQVLDHENK